jgi:DNA-binding CsgD family transcriptional regulator
MLENLIRSVGTDSFGPTAFAFLRHKLVIRHLTIARFAHYRPIEFFAVESSGGEGVFYPALHHYMRGFYVGDPLRPYYHGSETSEHLLFSVSADQVSDREVRERLYSSVGIVGKLSLVIRRQSDVLTLSVLRSQNAGCFNTRDVNMMRALSGVLAAMVERHVSLLEPETLNNLTELSKLIAEIPSAAPLSKQEKAVCARIIAGYSTESIALNLGVSTHSIATYRRRAYAKLNVSSQNQLFMLLLGLCGRRPVSAPRLGVAVWQPLSSVSRSTGIARDEQKGPMPAYQ